MAKDEEYIHRPLLFKRRLNSVEAVRLTEDNVTEVHRWCGGLPLYGTNSKRGVYTAVEYPTFSPDLLNRIGLVEVGEWLVKDENGRFFTMSDQLFQEEFYYPKAYKEHLGKG